MMKLLLLVVCFVPPWLGSLVKEVLLLGEVTATGTRRQATTAYMFVLSLPPADALYVTVVFATRSSVSHWRLNPLEQSWLDLWLYQLSQGITTNGKKIAE